MSKFKIATQDQLQPSGQLCVEVEGQHVALFRVEGSLYAIENNCPHMGGKLAEGQLQDHIIICPLHSWEFDIRDGRCIAPAWHPKAKPLDHYAVTLEGEDIFVHRP